MTSADPVARYLGNQLVEFLRYNGVHMDPVSPDVFAPNPYRTSLAALLEEAAGAVEPAGWGRARRQERPLKSTPGTLYLKLRREPVNDEPALIAYLGFHDETGRVCVLVQRRSKGDEAALQERGFEPGWRFKWVNWWERALDLTFSSSDTRAEQIEKVRAQLAATLRALEGFAPVTAPDRVVNPEASTPE